MKPQQADAHKQPAHPPAITVTPFAGIRPTKRANKLPRGWNQSRAAASSRLRAHGDAPPAAVDSLNLHSHAVPRSRNCHRDGACCTRLDATPVPREDQGSSTIDGLPIGPLASLRLSGGSCLQRRGIRGVHQRWPPRPTQARTGCGQ